MTQLLSSVNAILSAVRAPIIVVGTVVVLTAAVMITTQAQTTANRSRNRSTPAAARNHTRIIRAEGGESLAQMAERLNFPVDTLAQLNARNANSRLTRGQKVIVPATDESPQAVDQGPKGPVVGQRIKFVDGGSMQVNEVWKQGSDTWYKSGGFSYQATRPVKSVEPIFGEIAKETKTVKETPASQPAKVAVKEVPLKEPAASGFSIYLVGGARIRVDEVNERDGGAWYRRGNLSMFLDRERIARIEKDEINPKAAAAAGWKESGWSSGNANLDQLIRVNGARFGVDPYLVFCVIEQESQFHLHALSPKGARGLMQLMPGTAARFGVRNSFDPSANIFAGTQYLKGLLQMFGGRVDLALASYNAGEGAVMKYGRQVPPYRETQDYVKKISKRYGAKKE